MWSVIVRKSLVCFAIGLVLFHGRAEGSVISGAVTGGSSGGTFVLIAPPANVGNNNFQSPNLFAFNERQNVGLTAPLVTNVGMNPIPAGAGISSHYVFFDPVSATITGTVDFDADVLAIITSTGDLIASDFLGAPGTNYLSPGLRGLEPGDSVSISGPRQISLSWGAATPGDYVRVITVTTPEPASFAAFGVGIVGLGVWRKMRRRTV